MKPWLALLLALVLAGCTAAAPASSGSTESTSRSGSSTSPGPDASEPPTPLPSPTEEPLPSDLDPALAHAIDMRRGAGLRYDLDYVIAAETDPRATIAMLDFPMYPEEQAKLTKDAAEQQEIVAIVQSYAAEFEDQFGGLYIDREIQPTFVTTLWTQRLDEHETAIRRLIGDRTLFAVRLVKYSHAELRTLQDEVVKDWRSDWIANIPARFRGVGVHISENVLVIDVSSANPDADAIIEAHYALGDRLQVQSDGTGAALLPWGTVKGKVVGPDGKTVKSDPPLDLHWEWKGDDPGECGGGDVGYGVAHDGTFELPCQVGNRTIAVIGEPVVDQEWTEYGRATVFVQADKTTKVTIRLTALP